MRRFLKNLVLGAGIVFILFSMNCGPQIREPFDPGEQLAIDIELIEAYLAEQGITEYDTLESEVRVYLENVGDGEDINFNEIISYDYIGKFLNDTLFDASIGDILYYQDSINVVDTVYQTNKDGSLNLDDEGNKIVDYIQFTDGYFPVFSSIRDYVPFITTHTQGGWFLSTQNFEVAGFPLGVHYALSNLRINGRCIVLIPSGLAYGNTRSRLFRRFRNQVLIFEILPVGKL